MSSLFARSAVAVGLAAFLATPLAAHAATPKDTLVVAWALDQIITMDPGETFEVTAGEFTGNGYDRLVRTEGADLSKLRGDAAKSWSVSEDGKTYAFELKPNLKFASGNPMTAEDVVFSLQRSVLMDKSPAFILRQFGLNKENVQDKIRQTGPLTLTMEVDKAYAPTLVLNCLTSNVAAIVDKKLVLSHEKDGDLGNGWLRTHSAGSGPFKLRDYRPNEIVVLERNEHYTLGPKAKVSRVIYRHVKEAATQRLLLEKGDIDIARNLQPQDYQAIADNKDLTTTSTPRGTVVYIGLNQKNPHLAKPEVREALKWLVDYEGIGKVLLKDIGVIHQNFLPVGLLGASTEKPYKLDVDKAKALLQKAGLANGFKLTIDMRTTQPIQGITENFQQTAKRAGVDIEVIPGDGKQTMTKYRARQHDMYIGAWGADYWDPHTNASAFARNPDNSDDAKVKPLAWRNAWEIPELSRMTEAAALERDPEKRKAIYEKLQAELRARSPYVILYQQIDTAGLRSNVKGYRLGETSGLTNLSLVSK